MNERYSKPTQHSNLIDLIQDVEPDIYSRTIAVGEQRERIETALEQLGLLTHPQSRESIEQGVADARWLTETSNAAHALKEHPFVDADNLQNLLEKELPTARIDFPSDDPVYIAWDKLDGAAAFKSWQGRGMNGSGEVGSHGSSLDKILDFATRETRLPSVQLCLILTRDGPITIAMNSHRAAAAILRNEDIGCDYLRVIDATESEIF